MAKGSFKKHVQGIQPEINKGRDQPKIPPVIEKSEKSPPVRRSRTPHRRA